MSESSRGRVLIVDDDIDVVETLKALFSRYHYYVRTATSEAEATEEISQDRFDVTILDWVMPSGGGRELVGIVREHCPHTYVVVHSAFESSDIECTSAGADDFVEKTHRINALRNNVERGVKICRERWAAALKSESESHDSLAEAITGCLLDKQIATEDAQAVSCSHEPLAFGVASELLRKSNESKWPKKVLDCKSAASRRQDSPTASDFDGQDGLFGFPLPHVLVLRNAQFLDRDSQASVLDAVKNQSFRRSGSSRQIQSQSASFVLSRIHQPFATRRANSKRSFVIATESGFRRLQISKMNCQR